VDMNRLGSPNHGRDGYERIAFPVPPCWRSEMTKRQGLSVKSMRAKRDPNVTYLMIQ
jgi:hypothetical protein